MTKTVGFEIPDDVTALSGVAFLTCTDAEGAQIVQVAHYGDCRAVEEAGLIAFAKERNRTTIAETLANLEETE